MPAELLEERGLLGEDLVVIRAPSAVPGRRIVVGDRLLVDVGDAARRPLPGLLVTWNGKGHEVVRARGMRGGLLWLEGNGWAAELEVGEAEIVGRVVGRWTWM